MLIYMVHGTFFQELTQKGQVTDWAAARKDQTQIRHFRRGLMIEVFHPDAKTPSCSEMFTRFVTVDKISSKQSFKSFVGRASNSQDFVFILRMIFLTSI